MEGGGVTFLGGPSAGFRTCIVRANPEQIANPPSSLIRVRATHGRALSPSSPGLSPPDWVFCSRFPLPAQTYRVAQP